MMFIFQTRVQSLFFALLQILGVLVGHSLVISLAKL